MSIELPSVDTCNTFHQLMTRADEVVCLSVYKAQVLILTPLLRSSMPENLKKKKKVDTRIPSLSLIVV